MAGRGTQIGNAYHNQLETPLLFYVLILLALVTQTADLILFVLSWLFVASRFVHAYIHLTTNRIDRRAPVFLVGAIGLALMWIIVAARLTIAVDRMTPGARVSAAIEVLADIADAQAAGAEALKDWGLPIASPAPATGRPSATSSSMPCAARLKRLCHGRRQPARSRVAHARFELGRGARSDSRACRWQPLRAGSPHSGRARRD